jgi:hypothetical protein
MARLHAGRVLHRAAVQLEQFAGDLAVEDIAVRPAIEALAGVLRGFSLSASAPVCTPPGAHGFQLLAGSLMILAYSTCRK